MTIYELNDILSLKDQDKISAEIEKRGFRRAGEVGEWEFSPKALSKESDYKKSVLQRDEQSGNEYCATLYQGNRRYIGATFISLTLFVTLPDRGNISVPTKSTLFTDAPHNAEYIREINSPYKCDICGREHIKKELCEYDDRFLCGDCLAMTFNEESNEELIEALLETAKSNNVKTDCVQ